MEDSENYILNISQNYTIDKDLNCSVCRNELCLSESDYSLYKSWVSVDTYELILITLNIVVFCTGLLGNSLVSNELPYRVFK